MIQIGSVVIVSSELSLKTVTYESWGSSGPDLQDQTSTWSIWSTYVPRKNDLSIFRMYIHSRNGGFPWTGYSIPIINHGWWMMDRWWWMMEGGLMADDWWWMMMDDPLSAIHHPAWVIHQWSIISHPPSIITDSSSVIFMALRSVHLHDACSTTPLKFATIPAHIQIYLDVSKEKQTWPEIAMTNYQWLPRIPRLIATDCLGRGPVLRASAHSHTVSQEC